ncbi:MAG: VOC family protein [Gammaproteobacteria bacterium]
MSNADPRGKFVWHELLSADAAAATAFYTKVVPWKLQPWEQDSSYSMWVAKNGPVGGIAKLDGSAPPHWLPYVAVPDVGATADAAKGLGGRVLKDKSDLPNGGSYAVLVDPQGAQFAVYQSGGETGGNGASTPSAGDFSWHELATTDAKAAMEFYTKLLGWEAGPVHDMGPPAGNYHLFLHQGNQYGGMFVSPDGTGTGPSWLCYISVDDVGKAASAAKSAGGRVMNGPMEVPGGSWIAQVMDSEGAPFAVHEAAKSAKPAAKPEKPAKAPKPKAEKVAAPAAEPVAAKPAEVKPAAKPAKPAAAPAAAAPAAAAAKPAAAKPAAVKPTAAKPAVAVAKPAAAKPAAVKPAAKPAAKAPAKAPAKAAAKKGKKAAAKKAPAKKVAKKVARKAAKKVAAKGKAKAAAKKGKKAAKKAAPAKKKASRAKAKKHR